MTEAKLTSGGRPNPWRAAIWSGAAALWALPLVAMQFTSEVDWSVFDFIVFGTMLASACLAYEVLARRTSGAAYRAGAGVAVIGGFLLVWVNLAVGIIGSEDNPANWMYVGLLGLGVAGALIANFRARGMAATLFAMAAAQVAIAGIALAGNLGTEGINWPRDVIGASALFTLIWMFAGGLFRRAAAFAGA